MAPAWNWHIPYKCTTDERHGEQEPATKGAIVGDGTDGGKYGCYDRKADAKRGRRSRWIWYHPAKGEHKPGPTVGS